MSIDKNVVGFMKIAKQYTNKYLLYFVIVFALLVQSVMGMGNRIKLQELADPSDRYVAISGGDNHCLALKTDGSIDTWGNNKWGKAEPPEGNDYVAIAAGKNHSVALRKDGTIVQWGYNNYGKITPPEGRDFIAIAAGKNHSMAWRADNSVVLWGDQYNANIKQGKGEDLIKIASNAGIHAAFNADGHLYNSESRGLAQMELQGNKDIVAVATGGHHSMALKADGSVIGWGHNTWAQANAPQGSDFIDIAVGRHHSVALRSDGSVISWGLDVEGQVGSLDNDSYVDVVAGGDFCLGLRKDGRIIGWGSKSVFYSPIIYDSELLGSDVKEDVVISKPVEISDVNTLVSLVRPPKEIRFVADEGLFFDLVYICPGRFKMGRNTDLLERTSLPIIESPKGPNEWPSRKVTITKGFYIGKYKVTCEQFCAFLNSIKRPDRYFKLHELSRVEKNNGIYVPKPDCVNCAISFVPWGVAAEFCLWLSDHTGFTVRLPTEAEWEFTARGSEDRTYPWGEDKDVEYQLSTAYHYKKYPHRWSCASVDAFPNDKTPDGVIGMAGRGFEWCSDYYLEYYLSDDVVDPKGPQKIYKSHGHVYRSDGRFTISRGSGSSIDVDPRHFEQVEYGFRIVVGVN